MELQYNRTTESRLGELSRNNFWVIQEFDSYATDIIHVGSYNFCGPAKHCRANNIIFRGIDKANLKKSSLFNEASAGHLNKCSSRADIN